MGTAATPMPTPTRIVCATPCADPGQFDVLYRRWYDVMYRTAYLAIGNASDAEDVTQEAFVRAWGHFEHFDCTHRFDAWIRAILKNVVADWYRHRSQARRQTDSVVQQMQQLPHGTVPWSAGDGIDPQAHVMRDSARREILHSIDQLPADHRDIARMVILQSRTYAEVAERVGCPIGTVRSRLHRARRALQRELDQVV